MTAWSYVLACLTIPAVWGVLMYFAFNALDRRRSKSQRQRPPVDYSI